MQSFAGIKYVPFTRAEWKKVQSCYMSTDISELETAYDVINMWMCRMGNRTPVIIEISELLLRAVILCRRQKIAGLFDDVDRSLIYGMILIRFVNYVNEVCQPDRLVSIYSAVQKLNMPGWIVSIRHQVTHGQMPPMEILRRAIMHCHRWLWDQHWSRPYDQAIKEPLSKEIVEQKLLEQRQSTRRQIFWALDEFFEWRQKNPILSIVGLPLSDLLKEANKPIKKLGEFLDVVPEQFIPAFVDICLAQGEIVDDIYVDFIGNAAIGYKHITKIPTGEQNYYQPILELITKKNHTGLLLHELVRAIANEAVPFRYRSRLSGWADLLFQALILKAEAISVYDWKSLLESMIQMPQFFADLRIQELLGHLVDVGQCLSDEFRTSLDELLDIVSAVGTDGNVGVNNNSTSLDGFCNDSATNIMDIDTDGSSFQEKSLLENHQLQNELSNVRTSDDLRSIIDQLQQQQKQHTGQSGSDRNLATSTDVTGLSIDNTDMTNVPPSSSTKYPRTDGFNNGRDDGTSISDGSAAQKNGIEKNVQQTLDSELEDWQLARFDQLGSSLGLTSSQNTDTLDLVLSPSPSSPSKRNSAIRRIQKQSCPSFKRRLQRAN